MKKCISCNNEIDDSCIYCSICGHKTELNKESDPYENFEDYGTSDPYDDSGFYGTGGFGTEDPYTTESFGGSFDDFDPYKNIKPERKIQEEEVFSDPPDVLGTTEQSNIYKQSEKSKRKGILGPFTICIVVALIVCSVLFALKGNIFNGSEQQQSKNLNNKDTSVSDPANVKVSTPTPIPTPTPEPELTASLVSVDTLNSEELVNVEVVSADSTSEIQQDNVSNAAINIFDNNIETNWQEGVDGAGIGQSVTAYFADIAKVKGFLFKVGNWKSDRYYYGNNRPSKIQITMGDFSSIIEFPDSWEEFAVELSRPVEASSVTITLEDVYKGTDWDDTAISDIRILGQQG